MFESLLYPDIEANLKKILSRCTYQKTEEVGKCVVYAIRSGKNGSIWLTENSRIQELKMHDFPEIDFHKNMF